MDTGYEDKIYHQVKESLSNNINEKLFVPIEMIDRSHFSGQRNKFENAASYKDDIMYEDHMYTDNYTDSYMKETDSRNKDQASTVRPQEDKPVLSRAEFIRLAREACLRQLNAIESSSGSGDIYIGNEEMHNSFFGKKRKDKAAKLFQEGKAEENMPEEIASYKSLIIRTVCALVIFLSIFIIDKIKVNWGKFSYETIRQYVTGNDHLKEIEDVIVSWLK